MTNEKDKKSIYKPRPVSGFPEWLPEVRLVEQQWMDHIRRVFESYGFCSVETPSVEELDVLRAKGEVDKEIYVIERLHKEDGEKDEARLALHFDQTVPLARYVAQHFNDLVFPFKRYQMQRVWRGERPQAGRFREFYQCDIDVINVDQLPLHFDAEMPAIIWEILSALPGMENENIQLRISNRKILLGFLDGLKVNNREGGASALSEEVKTLIVREIDKLHKLGKPIVLARIDELGMQAGIGMGLHSIVEPFIDLCLKPFDSAEELTDALTNSRDIDTSNPVLQEGIKELTFVLEQLEHFPRGKIVGDLSIVRGLDYYTGTVYETVFINDINYGSICSGGRYEDLAGSYINKKLPGVGISIGFSRLFDRLRVQNKLPVSRKCPADILMALPKGDTEEQQSIITRIANETARILRERDFKVEMYHAPKKNIGDQVKYANRKGIPFVWFPPIEKNGAHEIKDMINGTQHTADPETWHPQQEGKNAAVA